MASSFGGRLIVVVRQAEETLTVNNINIFYNLKILILKYV